MESRLQEARGQLADQRSQSNEKIATLGSLVNIRISPFILSS